MEKWKLTKIKLLTSTFTVFPSLILKDLQHITSNYFLMHLGFDIFYIGKICRNCTNFQRCTKVKPEKNTPGKTSLQYGVYIFNFQANLYSCFGVFTVTFWYGFCLSNMYNMLLHNTQRNLVHFIQSELKMIKKFRVCNQ